MPDPIPPKAPDQHPVQTNLRHRHGGAKAPQVVTLRAYEVYKEVHGPEPALIDLEGRNCRGGFGVCELIAFLYARSFPRSEWRARTDEAFRGLDL